MDVPGEGTSANFIGAYTMNDLDLPILASHSHFPRLFDSFAHRAFRGRGPKVEQFVGIVRDGPSSASGADYSDSRYYVDRAIATRDSGSAGPLSAKSDTLPGLAQTVTATNLAELPTGMHLLPAGTL